MSGGGERVAPETIRARFAAAMSAMYAREVPLYGTLLDIVRTVNAEVLAVRPEALPADETARLGPERHGAIRLGSPGELADLARMFAVMGMAPVGYYDLAPAGIPVHSTAFRPTTAASLAASPFRIFTSLLRLDLIEDAELRGTAEALLACRRILSPRALDLAARSERQGGLDAAEADAFVAELLETFRWHGRATVDRATYARLRAAHPLVADIVAFPGPHINHLTPRTLDIDRTHAAMLARGLRAKDAIEGPPARAVPILLRQTSFHALEEPVRFAGEGDAPGGHTARFGEIEQRGLALTPKGRALFDRLLADGRPAAFGAFPDDAGTLRRERLGHFRYRAGTRTHPPADADPDMLVAGGWAVAEPITYEDFLPVSAAGIFRSNLSGEQERCYAAAPSQAAFEQALGRAVVDPFALYAAEERASLDLIWEKSGHPPRSH